MISKARNGNNSSFSEHSNRGTITSDDSDNNKVKMIIDITDYIILAVIYNHDKIDIY